MSAILPINYFNTFIGKKTGFISSSSFSSRNDFIAIFPSIWYGAFGYSSFGKNTEKRSDFIKDRNWFVEESRIQGGFNNNTVSLGVRAYANVENPDQLHRSNSLIFSGVFNSRTGFNETNVFSIGESITTSLDPLYGDINKLYTSNNDLTAFQEYKVSRILVDKDALYTAEGKQSLTSSNVVLGQVIPYAGDYGISRNPESWAVFGFRQYFTDVHRGKVLRLSNDGLSTISDYGMNDFFRDQSSLIEDNVKVFQVNKTTSSLEGLTNTLFLNDTIDLDYGMGVIVSTVTTQAYIVNITTNSVTLSEDVNIPQQRTGGFLSTSITFFKYVKDRVLGSWDNFNKQYVVSYNKALLGNNAEDFTFYNNEEIKNTSTLTFDEQVKGWCSYYTYRPNNAFSLKNNYYTFKNGKIWKHYSSSVINNRGTFYNQYKDSSIKFVINDNPSTKKVFQTINYEGDNGFEVKYFNSDIQRVDPDYPYTNPLTYNNNLEYKDKTSNSNIVSVSSYEEGKYLQNGYNARAGFSRKENLYTANLTNRSSIRPGEIIFGDSISGIKGYFATVEVSTDSTTNPGGLKELWSIGSKYVVSS